ncbi:MAG: hypothetical protein R3F61_31825 [Myxococcota bacterium]
MGRLLDEDRGMELRQVEPETGNRFDIESMREFRDTVVVAQGLQSAKGGPGIQWKRTERHLHLGAHHRSVRLGPEQRLSLVMRGVGERATTGLGEEALQYRGTTGLVGKDDDRAHVASSGL